MIYLIAFLAALTATLLAASGSMALARSRSVSERLNELASVGHQAAVATAERQRRQRLRQRMQDLLRQLGERVAPARRDPAAIKKLLVQAGHRSPAAYSTYMGTRVVLAVTLAVVGLAWAMASGVRTHQAVAACVAAGMLGWIGPAFYLDRQVRRRQKGIRRALPDALDLLVVCVEAGLGLNQALVRVAEEIRHVNRSMSEDLVLVNLEIRAGVERVEALRNLGERTGVDDIRALTAMLIQTDRFGTSIATALRTQSDALRTKRRQEAEEAAAKTTIKLVPPLVICIFPAIFAVVLGPAGIQIFKFLRELKTR